MSYDGVSMYKVAGRTQVSLMLGSRVPFSAGTFPKDRFSIAGTILESIAP